jgi:hypothetical protein
VEAIPVLSALKIEKKRSVRVFICPLMAVCTWAIFALTGPLAGAQGTPSPPGNPVPTPAQLCGGNSSQGYWLAAADGGVFSFGAAGFFGSMAGHKLNAPIVAIDSTGIFGYWLVGADGGVFNFGCAAFYGSASGLHLNAPVVGIGSPEYGGYWLVSADGGVFSFGGTSYFGSMAGQKLSAPIVGMAATDDAQGYWLVGADGGVFAFGDARYEGSEANKISAPIAAIVAKPTLADSYWLVGADGSVYNFGLAQQQGSASGTRLAAPIVGMTAIPLFQSCNPGGCGMTTDAGYRLVGADGGVFDFGGAQFLGSMAGHSLAKPIVGIASLEPPGGGGAG